MKVPGFYRVRVWAVVDGKKYEGLATAGFEPEKIQPTVKDPGDFDNFWSNTIAEARKLSLDPKLTLMPERCTSDVNVFHISFQNEIAGSRIYGILCVPKKPGKYPAILRVPGAGIRPYGGDSRTASLGIITLEIGIHGIPVNLDPQVYTDLSNGALNAYNAVKMNDRNTHYYKRVYIGCVKAVDFIFSLPEFNGTDVAVTGGSQGGALTIVTAGLDKRIKYAAALYPALCDHTGYLNKRAGGWPHYFKNTEPKPGEVETLGYYDVVNFARRVTVPGFYTWGYNDLTCPPTSMYSAYNVITAAKELQIFQETGHWTFPEQNEAVNNWLVKQLKGQ
jgi:cephalosporin-C deacetylase-like acetyl esterase